LDIFNCFDNHHRKTQTKITENLANTQKKGTFLSAIFTYAKLHLSQVLPILLNYSIKNLLA
jgi:hypothetical protein